MNIRVRIGIQCIIRLAEQATMNIRVRIEG